MNDKQHLIQQLIQDNRIEEAKAQCLLLCQEQPGNVDAWFTMGFINAQSGALDAAADNFQQVLSILPHNAEAHFNLGKIAALQNQTDMAIRHYQQAIRSHPHFAEAYNNLGNIQYRLGHLQTADKNFKQALRIQPGNPEYNFNYANILRDNGEYQQALKLYQDALRFRPQYPAAYYNMGRLYQQQDQPEQALQCYRHAIQLKSDYMEAFINLAALLKIQGDPESAIEYLKQAISINPEYPEAYNHLGSTLKLQGQNEPAKKYYSKALKIRPDYPEVYNNLGLILQEEGDNEAAINHYQQALKLKPDFADAYYNLAITFQASGQTQTAIEYYHKALQINPDFAAAYNNLGNLLGGQGLVDDAINNFRKALSIKPDFIGAHNNLGNFLRDQGLVEEGIRCYQQALAIDPESPGTHNNLGNALKESGQFEAALVHYRKALALKPDYAEAHSNLLFLLSYNVLCTPQQMLEESQQWGHIHGKHESFSHPAASNENRCLRIGYVSPDLRHHAVSFFFEPILTHHDPKKVEVFCYAEVKHPDAVTQRLQTLAQHWRSTVGVNDEAVARMIHDDHIDILIDLAGHTANSRIKVFTYKPAPVQATYLGYFTTTGLAAMDYWITDNVLHPENTVELASETLYRLPRCCLAYKPDHGTPPVAQRSQDEIVFGSFNQLTKTTPQAIQLWAKILHAIPGAQMLIKTKQLADAVLRSSLEEQFNFHGITADRLILLTHTPSHREHLATYGQIDIALDTIPRTGGSTTAEALWMGVPVITLAGERFIERLSASMLTAVGLTDCIASSTQDYIQKAVALANNPQQRQLLRHTLRQRMTDSSLCDDKGLSQTLEKTYQNMWRRYLV